MEGFNKNQELVSNTVTEKFCELFGAELVTITYDELPEVVRDHFERQSCKFILPEEFKQKNFSVFYRFEHPHGDVTYVGQQDKTYDTKEGDTERLTYFADMRGDVITGYIEVRYALTNTSDYFKDKPFVGFNRTHDRFQGQGLAQRRLEEANAYTQAEYGYVLNSDTLLSEEAKGVWEKLVALGKAEKYIETIIDKDRERFRFIVE